MSTLTGQKYEELAETTAIRNITKSMNNITKMAFIIFGIVSMLILIAWGMIYPYEEWKWRLVPMGIGASILGGILIFYYFK